MAGQQQVSSAAVMTASLLLLILLSLSPAAASPLLSLHSNNEDKFAYNAEVLMSGIEGGSSAVSPSRRTTQQQQLLLEEIVKLRTRQRFLAGTTKQNSSCTIMNDLTYNVKQICTTDLRYFASSLVAEPTTSIQKLIVRSITDNCYPEDSMNVSAIGCHRPWSRNNLFHASLFRNFLYCPGSLLDGAITCLETTSQADCVANAACTWTNQTFVQTGSSNSSVQMMNIIYNTIIYSIGWHKGPLLTMFANGITKPPSYCAARWTVNQTFLESLYGNYNDSLKWYMNKYPTSAAALVWPEGKALTGNCTAGSKFTSWASLCTNATTELACPSSKFWFYKTGVGCTWNGTTNACRAGAMVTDNIMFLKDGAVDPWVATVMNMETLCSHGDSLSNCSNYGIPFTYDTARLGNLSQITVQLEDVQSTAAGQSSGLRVGLMVVLMQLVVTAMLSTNIGNAVLAPAMV